MKIILGLCIFMTFVTTLLAGATSNVVKDSRVAENKTKTNIDAAKGTEGRPLFVKIVPDLEAKPKADGNAQIEDTKPREDRTIEIVSIALTAFATCVMAFFTVSLARSTRKLWVEAKTAGAIAQTTASAALRAAEVAERSLMSTERAFVFLKYAYASPVFDGDKKIVGWDIHVVWENAGPTPTQNMFTYKNILSFPNGIPEDFPFPDVVLGNNPKSVRKTFIGPKAIIDAGAQFVPLSVLNAVAEGNERLYAWGWTEYGHVFKKDFRSRSEFCFEIVLSGRVDQPPTAEIKPPFTFVNHGIHNGSEDECFRPPGQEIPVLRLPP